MRFKKNEAVTFLEIIVAVSIIAIAMIPLFGLMSRETVETDRNVSTAYATNKATEVLNTLLGNVPFAAIRQGNPGYIRVDDLSDVQRLARYDDNWAERIVPMLFPGSQKGGAGWPCRGIAVDSRGIHYLVHLRVEDVPAVVRTQRPEEINIGTGFPQGQPVEFSESSEVTFSFLRNPSMLTDPNWVVDYAFDLSETGKPLVELDLDSQISQAPGNIYRDQGPAGTYRFTDPTAARYKARMVSRGVPYDAPEQFTHVPFKKLIVQVQWNLEPRYFSNPEHEGSRIQRVHLMTIKGDID